MNILQIVLTGIFAIVAIEFWNEFLKPKKLLKFKRISPTAQIPERATSGAACFDLHYCNFDRVGVLKGQTKIISTGLKVEIPKGYALLLFSRSGHAYSSGLRLANCVGVIDSDYRGEIKVMMHSDLTDVIIKPRERIAQAMLVKLPDLDLVEVDELSETLRGCRGFGSTGK